MKEDKSSRKNSDSKGVTSELTHSQGSKSKLPEGNAGVDNSLDTKLPVCKSVVTSNIETLLVDQGDLNTVNDASTFESFIVSEKGESFPNKTIMMSAEETDQRSCLSEKSVIADPFAQQVKPDIPVQPVRANEPHQDTIPDYSEVETNICSVGTKEKKASSGDKVDVDEMTSSMGSDHENSRSKISTPVCMTRSDSDDDKRNKSGGNASMQHMDDIEPPELAKGEVDMKDTSTTNVSRKTEHDIQGSESQSPTSKLPLVQLVR